MRKTLLLLGLFIPSFICISQEYEWWNKNNNWDGVTHWTKYIIVSPEFMGPNALPVPDIKDGKLFNKTEFELDYDYHYSKGDITQNVFSKINIPFKSDNIGVSFSMVPVEYYDFDSITRDLRHSREFDGKGYSVGDVFIGTYIQLLSNKRILPDVLLTINIKTASGSNFSSARFTDAPAYFFDMSFGKEYYIKNTKLKSIKPYIMSGFYCWQTNDEAHFQDDAIIYGAGLNLNFNKFIIQNSFGGYIGYLNNGDKPCVYRAILKTNFNSATNYNIMYQQGLNDFYYKTFRIGLNINLDKIVTKKTVTI